MISRFMIKPIMIELIMTELITIELIIQSSNHPIMIISHQSLSFENFALLCHQKNHTTDK